MSHNKQLWCPCTVTTAANCRTGLDSMKEGGNLAPEGTKVTAELATCRGRAQHKLKQSGVRVANTETGGQCGLGFRFPKCPWRAGRSQSWSGAVYAPQPSLPLARLLVGPRIKTACQGLLGSRRQGNEHPSVLQHRCMRYAQVLAPPSIEEGMKAQVEVTCPRSHI